MLDWIFGGDDKPKKQGEAGQIANKENNGLGGMPQHASGQMATKQPLASNMRPVNTMTQVPTAPEVPRKPVFDEPRPAPVTRVNPSSEKDAMVSMVDVLPSAPPGKRAHHPSGNTSSKSVLVPAPAVSAELDRFAPSTAGVNSDLLLKRLRELETELERATNLNNELLEENDELKLKVQDLEDENDTLREEVSRSRTEVRRGNTYTDSKRPVKRQRSSNRKDRNGRGTWVIDALKQENPYADIVESRYEERPTHQVVVREVPVFVTVNSDGQIVRKSPERVEIRRPPQPRRQEDMVQRVTHQPYQPEPQRRPEVVRKIPAPHADHLLPSHSTRYDSNQVSQDCNNRLRPDFYKFPKAPARKPAREEEYYYEY
eukprot:TRINITY_DN1043_c0_g2_i1.p1 TRINITY_DN1043_c0_g2~~TRINITY_DN1043_c0_g2_i1.p1  ORF type:complete len:372 (+),score=67.08 TRINITY_DN1043_c0_g2_i1:55-1170(+)